MSLAVRGPVASSTVTGAYFPIATWDSPGNVGAATFNNIPQNFKDIIIYVYGRSSFSANYTSYSVYFNGTGATGWSGTYWNTNGTTVSQLRQTTSNPTYGAIVLYQPAANISSNFFGTASFEIFNYSTSTNKTVIAKGSTDTNGTGWVEATASLYQSSNVINTITVETNGNFVSGTKITLMGVRSVGQ